MLDAPWMYRPAAERRKTGMSDYFFKKRKLWASEKSVNKRPYERISNKCNGPIYLFIKDQASKRHAK